MDQTKDYASRLGLRFAYSTNGQKIYCVDMLTGKEKDVRDIINQQKTVKDALYCVRVTADDGKLDEQHLNIFHDNEKTIPTIITTSAHWQHGGIQTDYRTRHQTV